MNKKIKKEGLGKGFTQRKNGDIYARFTTTTGKRVGKTFKTYDEALAWHEDSIYQDRHGKFQLNSDITVNEWFTRWLENFKIPDSRPNTIRNICERYKMNIQPVIGRMKISNVKPLHCNEILNAMKNDYKTSTIKQTYTWLGSMFKSAVENDIISKNPIVGVNVKSIKSETKGEARYLTVEEEQKFLEVAKSTTNYDAYRLILLTGLRAGELIALTWSSIDFSQRIIHVTRTLHSRYKEDWYYGDPKTASSKRDIPMTNECYELLINLREERKKHPVTIENPMFKDIIFINREHRPTNNRSYDSHMRKLAEKAGIEKLSMHTLRHTFATRCIESGMPPKVLQQLLGHRRLTTSMDLYVHVTDDSKQKGMQLFEQYIVNNRTA